MGAAGPAVWSAIIGFALQIVVCLASVVTAVVEPKCWTAGLIPSFISPFFVAFSGLLEPSSNLAVLVTASLLLGPFFQPDLIGAHGRVMVDARGLVAAAYLHPFRGSLM